MSQRVVAGLESKVQAAALAATQRGVAQWAGLRVELPDCDSLALFEAMESSEKRAGQEFFAHLIG